MKLVGLLIISLVMILPGCFSVPIDAPYGQNVRVLPANKPVEVTYRYQKWYALWGLFPLTPSDTPKEIIAREGLSEVRVYTEDSIEDAISGIFYVLVFPTGIIVPQTIVIEGNRRPTEGLKHSIFHAEK